MESYSPATIKRNQATNLLPILFHSHTLCLTNLVTINEKILVYLVSDATIVVVYAAVATAIVGHEHVSSDVAPKHASCGGPVIHICDVRLPIPRIDGAVVAALLTSVEHKVLGHHVPAPETVVLETENASARARARVCVCVCACCMYACMLLHVHVCVCALVVGWMRASVASM